MKKSLLALGGVVVCAAMAVAIGVAKGPPTFDAPYPDIHASSDPKVIARGAYLARGPAHCIDCHGENLAGGLKFPIPIGNFYTPNITPDVETGIARRTDGELARILRHGVRADGKAALTFMPFANLSDEDLTAVISYVRSVPPVRNTVPEHAPNLMGRLVRAFVIKPVGPVGTPAKSVHPARTAAYGDYLTHFVANCVGCHTERNMATGAYTGVLFAGGLKFENGDRTFTTPNLTPDPKTGRITDWSEETFVERFKYGAIAEGTEMPWRSFRNMSDADLRAIYRYLRTLKAVEHDTGPTVVDRAAKKVASL